MAETSTRVIYIAGVGRNGSTLLSRILGEHDECVNVGEALSYMLNSKLRNRHQQDVNNDPTGFWPSVFKECGFTFIADDIDHLLNEKNFGKLLKLVNAGDPAILEIARKIGIFLDVVQRKSGKQYIIDSSKQPNVALLLKHVKSAEVYVIHLVRNAADVANSRSVAKGYLQKASFIQVLVRWAIKNKIAGKLQQHFRYALLMYQDICATPYQSINSLFTSFSLPIKLKDELKQNRISFHPQNVIAGNPDKLIMGEVVIKSQSKKLNWIKSSVAGLFSRFVSFSLPTPKSQL